MKGIYNCDDANLIRPVIIEAPDNADINDSSKTQWLVDNLLEEQANKNEEGNNQSQETVAEEVTVVDKDDNTNKQANQKLASINPKQSNKEKKEKDGRNMGR